MRNHQSPKQQALLRKVPRLSISLFLISVKIYWKRRLKTMEMVLNNGFSEIAQEEMTKIDGGFWGSLIAGFIIDGAISAITGKSAGEWCADGIGYVWDKYFTITCY